MDFIREGAKDGARMATAVLVKWSLIGIVGAALVGGSGYYAYSLLRSPITAAKEKVIDAKNSVRDAGARSVERTKELAGGAHDATLRAKDAVADSTTHAVERAKEATGTTVEKAKNAGSAAIDQGRQMGSSLKDFFRKREKEEAEQH